MQINFAFISPIFLPYDFLICLLNFLFYLFFVDLVEVYRKTAQRTAEISLATGEKMSLNISSACYFSNPQVLHT